MKFISGLLGGKKKDGGFFLQLKEEPDEPMPKADSKPVEASNNGKKPTANSVKPTAPTANGKKPVDTVKVKDEDNKVEEVASGKVKEVNVEMIQTAKGLEAIAVPVDKKAAVKASKAEEPKETTFAPKYLIPKNNNIRRRPGANMTSFLDMASKVKTPTKQ
ncbi:hypothetical protein [Rivularia sp. UHCC 0363]|uniref:hypothetical protein n=1 Tax=Rivularia sp. UHCC 0363 TaxID=3110244 RepID=UPI002B201035|nr:hypothetical protein [Rivularia sp. UHCC 0363]MEA5598596.1 hypothetical protein [Rivularia sp. UHCC 0363]